MHRKTILVVEGHDDSRDICAAILEHHGYRVLQARDGATGLRLAVRHRPDLILTNVVLPGVDGWTLARQVRASEETASIPLVALSTLGFRTDREHSRRLGFAAYLVKPCSPSRVACVVRGLIGPPAASLPG